MQHEIITNALRTIAQNEGITEEEVRSEITLAISYALKSDGQKVQNLGKNLPCEGDAPTVEEIINYIVKGCFRFIRAQGVVSNACTIFK
jgi:hypothetical protein